MENNNSAPNSKFIIKKSLIKILLIISVLFLSGLLYFCFNSKKVTYYGYLKSYSTSGETKFYWYDQKNNQIVNISDQYAWFWAMPEEIPKDTQLTDIWFRFIDNNNDAVFKITGTRRQHDCDYYGPENCIEDIDIKTIEVVGENLKLEY